MNQEESKAYFEAYSSTFDVAVLHFGPAPTSRGVEAIRMAFDEFEDQYARLPREDEQKRLVTKLAWFEQQYKRLPIRDEMEQIIQQLEIQNS